MTRRPLPRVVVAVTAFAAVSLGALVVGAGSVGAVPAGLLGGSAAEAVVGAQGTPGFCPADDGVTVVVDFQRLGGATIVRCAPGTKQRTGLDALREAGFRVDGVQRWGGGFVCRIEGRPSATEPLAIPGDGGYREACIDTPPPSAYWSYWRASDGAGWRYSRLGVASDEVGPGDFEGWSFGLDVRGGALAPRVAPHPPGVHSSTRWTGAVVADDVERPATGSVWWSVLGLAAVGCLAALAGSLSVRRRRRSAPDQPA